MNDQMKDANNMKNRTRPAIITTMPVELWRQLKPLFSALITAGPGAAIMMQPFKDGIKVVIVDPDEAKKISRIIDPKRPTTFTDSAKGNKS